jgi:hypothetical protein
MMRVIVKTNLETYETEIFGSLAPFYDKYPEYLAHKDSIITALTRRKKPYQDSKIKLERKIVIR